MKKYIEVKPNRNATHIEIEVYYNLGGYNYFTGKSEDRGYYLSVSPVERRKNDFGITISYTAFSGIKQCIKPVSRKSEKAKQEAERIAPNFEKDLIRYVCEKNGLEIMGEN